MDKRAPFPYKRKSCHGLHLPGVKQLTVGHIETTPQVALATVVGEEEDPGVC